MNPIVKNIIRNTAIMALIGVTLAVMLPYMGPVLGVSSTAIGISANPLYSGAFFGVFGALAEAFKPLGNWIFGGNAAQKEAASQDKQVNIIIGHSSQKTQEPEVEHPGFCQRLEAERAVPDLMAKG